MGYTWKRLYDQWEDVEFSEPVPPHSSVVVTLNQYRGVSYFDRELTFIVTPRDPVPAGIIPTAEAGREDCTVELGFTNVSDKTIEMPKIVRLRVEVARFVHIEDSAPCTLSEYPACASLQRRANLMRCRG
jgi:hypothetical protein